MAQRRLHQRQLRFVPLAPVGVSSAVHVGRHNVCGVLLCAYSPHATGTCPHV